VGKGVVLLALLFALPLIAQKQPDYQLDKPLTVEHLNRLDSLIRANAPAPGALSATLKVANAFNRVGKAINAYTWLNRYTKLFPVEEKALNNRLKQFEKIALSQYPDSLNRDLYASYAVSKAPSEDAYIGFMRYISLPINFGRWQEAIEDIKKFIPVFPDKKEFLQDMIEICSRPVEGLRVTNLGDKVNTPVSEWDPNPTSDGEHLYFSGNYRAGGQGGDDVWVSDLVDGKWQTPKNLGRKVNGGQNETIDNITADGNTLLLSGNFMGTFGQFDIYSIDREGNDWGDLFHYPYPINTQYVDEGGNLTADRKALLFSSDRPGGVGEFVPLNTFSHGTVMGNMDIYVSFMTDSGWSNPVNLGTNINTPFAERSPYLHPDGKTLYFSSDGHPGLGGLDVFKSVRLDDSWTNWSKPINLGKEINTVLNDWGYKIGITGDSAFFSGYERTNGYGQWDLYSVTLPKSAKPEPVVMVSGTIRDSKGNKLQAEVIWEDLKTGEKLGSTKSNFITGHYFIVLPIGRNYGYYVKKEGYYPTSNNIDLSNSKDGDNVKVDIQLTSTKEIKEEKSSFTINNIFFDFDSSTLKPESLLELKRLSNYLKKNAISSLEVVGHTDKVGSKEYNYNLSLRRAVAVKNYLTDKDSKLQVSTIGKGADEPIDPNNDAKNRRVEIIVK
jgi:outer membrane protein OmpA-like peptidoglycan-associated protein